MIFHLYLLFYGVDVHPVYPNHKYSLLHSSTTAQGKNALEYSYLKMEKFRGLRDHYGLNDGKKMKIG